MDDEKQNVSMNQELLDIGYKILENEMFAMIVAHRPACLWYGQNIKKPEKLPGFIISLDSVAHDGSKAYPTLLKLATLMVKEPYKYDIHKVYLESDVVSSLDKLFRRAVNDLYFQDHMIHGYIYILGGSNDEDE